ncbi:unnamed protein product [Phytophthora lilii]|uniref:Unnamed protein product n=1 Tax=Phytophthora lilii TaxID=2077276 RepID=A0A9W6UFH1_9STRA|nr:unnamed protein product [Phytophthora lilii]
MQIHGQSEFNVFARPAASDDKLKWLWHDLLTDTRFGGQFSGRASHAMYHARNFSILSVLNDATPSPVASVCGEVINCASGKLFQTSFAGAEFALCSSGASGFSGYSSDITIAVEYVDNFGNTAAYALPNTLTRCPRTARPSTLTTTALPLLTGVDVPTSLRNLKQASHLAVAAPTCKCKSTPRPCIFFHGSGNLNEEKGLQHTPKKLKHEFGDISGHAPCCSTIKYAVLYIIDYGWMNDTSIATTLSR